MNPTTLVMVFGVSFKMSAIWPPTNEAMATTKMTVNKNTASKMIAVAEPRRQPRAARRFTPGSIANARNRETSNSSKSPVSRSNMNLVEIVTR